MNTLSGKLSGSEQLSEYWKIQVPVIQCSSVRPVFHESGYASGHANEEIAIPGLMDWLRDNPDPNATHRSFTAYDNGIKSAWAWVKIQFKDRLSHVFLHAINSSDVYRMSN